MPRLNLKLLAKGSIEKDVNKFEFKMCEFSSHHKFTDPFWVYVTNATRRGAACHAAAAHASNGVPSVSNISIQAASKLFISIGLFENKYIKIHGFQYEEKV